MYLHLLLVTFLLTPCTTMTIARSDVASTAILVDLVECWCIWVYTDSWCNAGESQRTLSNYWCMVMHLGHHGGITLITSVILCYTQLCSTLLYHNFMSCFTVPDCSMPCCIIPYHILSHLFVLLLLHSFDE